MQLAIFLGAGVSIPSELPGALEATNHILDDSKAINSGVEQEIQILKVIRDFDAADRKRPGLYETPSGYNTTGAINRGSASTYEDIHFLCSEMSLWQQGLVQNSLVTPFMEALAKRCEGALRSSSEVARLSELAGLSDNLRHHIEDTLVGLLNKKYLRGLDLILEIANDQAIKQLHIFTLNHDTLLEQFLSNQEVDFIDGFGKPINSVRIYDDGAYENQKTKVKIYKLHGAINWFQIRISGRTKFAILQTPPSELALGKSSSSYEIAVNRPSFLTGMDKGLLYHHQIYHDLFHRFSATLLNCNRIVMSGYSWGDFTINTFINTWLDRSTENRLVLLHQCVEELCERSIMFAEAMDFRINNEQLRVIPQWLCDFSFENLKPHL